MMSYGSAAGKTGPLPTRIVAAMRMQRVVASLVLGAAVLTGCATTPTQGGAGRSSQPAPPAQPRVLTMVVRYEINDLASKIPGGSSPIITKRLFNASLALVDGTGAPRPYLAESLPALNTDSWRVLPDGRMETTYHLRPGLTWQDGNPLTAEDFAFAYRVYTAPGLGVFIPTPQDLIESVRAADPRTVVFAWRAPYADAGALKYDDFEPLPRHILQESFAAYEQDAGTKDSFLNQPFWTSEYVGAGPFRLTRWNPGSEIEGTAFEGHALGRPKIDRLVVRIIADENSTLSTVLAGGSADFTADFTLRFEHARVLQREWESAGRGVVMLKRSGPVSNTLQLRPEFVGDRGLLDVRVRRALAHGIDRQGLNDGLFEGVGFVTENVVPEGVAYYADVDRAIDKHPYDPRAVDQLMGEAGYAKDREGFFANPAGERFKVEFRAIAGPEFERGQAIMVDTWRRAGIEVTSTILAANLVREAEPRHTAAGLSTRGGGLLERTWSSTEIGTAANRWVGDNRSGWLSPEYDRLFEAFSSTLDGAERTRHVVQMHKLVSENLPMLMLYHAIQVNTRVSGLRGPEAGIPGSGTLTPGTLPHWNIHEWELS
jgi:peptide/nickel transport system substrate-binding protein